jgi:hypothetical protein
MAVFGQYKRQQREVVFLTNSFSMQSSLTVAAGHDLADEEICVGAEKNLSWIHEWFLQQRRNITVTVWHRAY